MRKKRSDTAAIEARFWAKVNRKGSSDCWLWTASTIRGYGQFKRLGSSVYAHRIAYELTHGPIPQGRNVCHHCDTPLCVNPQHLFLGTQQENLDDARTKGRLVDGIGARKLSDAAYREILTATGRGVGVRLARKFHVSETHISRIRNGHSGVLYLRTVGPVFERVPFRQLPVVGDVA